MSDRPRLTTPEARQHWLECLKAAAYIHARTVLDPNAEEKAAATIADTLYIELQERCK